MDARESGCGRVLLLAVPDEGAAGGLLRRAVEACSGTRHVSVVDAHRVEADRLAARILAPHCRGEAPAPRALLRAWVAHLASQGEELVIGLDEPGGLPLDAARWLGRLVRASRGAARLILPWGRDGRLWRVIEELGLEAQVLGDPAGSPGSQLVTRSTPSPSASPPRLAEPRRAPRRVRRSGRAFAWSGLASCVALAVGIGLWWWLPAGTHGTQGTQGTVARDDAPPDTALTLEATPVEAAAPHRLSLTVRRSTEPDQPDEDDRREIEQTIRTLLADDPRGRHHVEALERLRSLDPVAAAREALIQFDELAPVGPLAAVETDEAREKLRAVLCRLAAGEEQAALPPELGCRSTPGGP